MMGMRLWIAALLLAAGPALADDVPNPSFYLVNRSASAISKVFATPAGMPNWGSDRLGGRAIPAGQNGAIRLPADGTCVYDIRVVYATGRSDERRGLNTCDVDNLTFPQGSTVASARPSRPEEDPSFVLINRSRTVLNEVYLSPTGDDSWGEDRLGDDTIPGGGSRTIRLPPGDCIYDIRVVFTNGDANEKRRLNLCQITNLRVP
jgi:hypothetical protein